MHVDSRNVSNPVWMFQITNVICIAVLSIKSVILGYFLCIFMRRVCKDDIYMFKVVFLKHQWCIVKYELLTFVFRHTNAYD